MHVTFLIQNESFLRLRASREGRVLLTFDKDFGELARDTGLSRECGIILFRMPAPKAGEIAARLSAVIADRSDWPGHFSVVEPGRVRMRRLTVR
jgi:hypothetical protein